MRRIFVLLTTASLALALGTARAQADPSYPIPSDANPAPPPIPSLPPAAATMPPVEAIGDPVAPEATCGDWHLQSGYADRWPTGSTWWEYECELVEVVYPWCHDLPGQCDAGYWTNVWAADRFYWDGSRAIFYGRNNYGCEHWWDEPTGQWYSLESSGCPAPDANPAPPTPTFAATPDEHSNDSTPTWTFSGEPGASFDCTLIKPFEGQWDGGPTGVEPPPPDVTVDSRTCDTGSYTFDLATYPDQGYRLAVTQTDAGGNTSPAATDYFRLDRTAWPPQFFTRPDEVSSDSTPTWVFVGEAGASFDCTLTRNGSTAPIDDRPCTTNETYTIDLGAHPDDTYTLAVVQTDLAGNTSEPATDSFTLDRPEPNAEPTARFRYACTGPACSVDAGGSSDADGTIVDYAWEFGDGTTGAGQNTQHTYPQPGTYTVELTVTDNAGASASTSKTITPIHLTARGYRVNGRKRVDLAWTGSSANGFDLYRNGRWIANVPGHSYTDLLARNASGTYRYQTCAPGGSICSNLATVSF